MEPQFILKTGARDNPLSSAMAIGYKADPARLADALKERDLAPRQRRPLGKFVFTGRWGQPSPLVLKRDI